MRHLNTLALPLLTGLFAAHFAASTAFAQTLDLPPEAPAAADSSSQPETRGGSAVVDPLRAMQVERFRRAASTSIGGYGELHLNHKRPEGGDATTAIDMHRLVLFVAHHFSSDVRFYTEIEVEHAFAKPGAPGEIGIEQGYLDWRLLGDKLGLRAGIVLVPMGIANQWHEPPVFHGVERPMVDKVILPSTWREGGVGLFGEPIDGLRYELYLVGGLDPRKFSAGSGLRGGRQNVAEARADALALTGRVEVEPKLGMVAGLSAYYSDAGPNARATHKVTGDDGQGKPIVEDLDLSVPVLGASADVRGRHAGLEFRAVGAFWSVGGTEDLRAMTDADGKATGVDVASQMMGGYVEVAYDVLHLVEHKHQLLPFVRYERYDTTFAADKGSKAVDKGVTDLVFGLSYRPLAQVVFKANATLRSPDEGKGATLVDLGVGWMF